MYPYEIMTAEDAKAEGYVSMTTPYKIHSVDKKIKLRDAAWWENIMRDFKGTKSVVVMCEGGPEMWRHNTELDICPRTGVKVKLPN